MTNLISSCCGASPKSEAYCDEDTRFCAECREHCEYIAPDAEEWRSEDGCCGECFVTSHDVQRGHVWVAVPEGCGDEDCDCHQPDGGLDNRLRHLGTYPKTQQPSLAALEAVQARFLCQTCECVWSLGRQGRPAPYVCDCPECGTPTREVDPTFHPSLRSFLEDAPNHALAAVCVLMIFLCGAALIVLAGGAQ